MDNKNDIRNRLKVFVESEYQKLVAYVTRSFNQRFFMADAEDIVQDVALNIYNKFDPNAPIENLAAYFYRALRNKVIDVSRKPRNNRSIEDYNYDDEGNAIYYKLPDESDEALNDVYQREKKYELIARAIEQLHPDQQAIIMETEYNAKTFEQLSAEWDIPIGTLLSRKHRAMARLRKMITQDV